jgi:hypothetical protein
VSTEAKAYKYVGTRPIRHDGADKVTGRANYGADINLPGMLYGAIVRSPHAHARILSIDTSAAAAMPGVKAVITGDDLPETSAKLAMGEGALDLHDIGRRQAFKNLSMGQHKDRNAQFENIATLKSRYFDSLDPLMSIDTKKRELMGLFYRDGQLYVQKTQQVWDHDFPSFGTGVGNPIEPGRISFEIAPRLGLADSPRRTRRVGDRVRRAPAWPAAPGPPGARTC